MIRTRLAAAVATLVVAAGLGACSAGRDDPTTGSSSTSTPAPQARTSEDWPRATPAQAGLRGRELQRLAGKARRAQSSCFAVFRDGRLVRDWNWGVGPDEPRQVFSVTKSVASALVGIAVKDGDLSLDDPVAKYVPQWRGTPSAGVTVRNLLSNDSGRFWSQQSDYVDLIAARNRTRYAIGLGQAHPPGTVWAYNNAAIQVLEAVLREATGRPVAELARERLLDPLGMHDSSMITDGSRAKGAQLFFGLQTTCRDLARFGQLYLDRGEVDGEQLVSRAFVEASVGRPSTPFNAAYGYLWWLNRPGPLRGATDSVGASGQPLQRRSGQLAPGAPEDLFAAIGLGGQVLLVDPGSRTLVVRLNEDLRTGAEYGFADAAEVVTRAVR